MMMLPTALQHLATIVCRADEAPPTPLSATDLYVGGTGGSAFYRIPSLTVTAGGVVLAFCEARQGDDGSPTDLVVRRSVDGLEWDAMEVVVPGRGEAIMNPTPVLDRLTGRLWLPLYEVLGGTDFHCSHPFAGRPLLTYSDDDGLSWAPPRDLSGEVGRFIPGPCCGIQLQSGRLVVPGYAEVEGAAAASYSCVMYSDDQGQSWRRGATVAAYTDESQAVETLDGGLLLVCRSNLGRHCKVAARSMDGGGTWISEADEAGLPEPVCQAALIRTEDPAALLFSGPWCAQEPPARRVLLLRASPDDGATWPVARLLEPGHVAYSAMAALPDGTLGVLYETGAEHAYERLCFARWDLTMLLGG
jgi:sialidase-1